jgi:large repetitive protein
MKAKIGFYACAVRAMLVGGLSITTACGGGNSSTGGQSTTDPRVQGFTATGSMQTAREGHTSTLLADGKVLITGGQGACTAGPPFCPLSSAELFDQASGGFTAVAGAMTAAGRTAAIPLLSGKVLIMGGGQCAYDWRLRLHCTAFTSAELFDPATGTFTPTGSMSEAHSAAVRLADGRVLVTGSGVSSAELFDETTGSFTFTGSTTVARTGPTATLLQDGQVLIVGGADTASGTNLTSAELYDPTTGTFNVTGSMATARLGHTATLLTNGKVLVVGGDYVGTCCPSTVTAELFDPTTGQFSATGNMKTDRNDHSATLLNSGKVLLAGGNPSNASAELYDPTTGQFSAVGNMKSGRMSGHTATLLSNGAVLVAGGRDNNGTAQASAELFQ